MYTDKGRDVLLLRVNIHIEIDTLIHLSYNKYLEKAGMFVCDAMPRTFSFLEAQN